MHAFDLLKKLVLLRYRRGLKWQQRLRRGGLRAGRYLLRWRVIFFIYNWARGLRAALRRVTLYTRKRRTALYFRICQWAAPLDKAASVRRICRWWDWYERTHTTTLARLGLPIFELPLAQRRRFLFLSLLARLLLCLGATLWLSDLCNFSWRREAARELAALEGRPTLLFLSNNGFWALRITLACFIVCALTWW